MNITSPLTLFCIVTIGLSFSRAAAPDSVDIPVTEPEKTLVYGFPTQLAYLQEKDWLVAVNYDNAYAIDIKTGREMWRNNRGKSFAGRNFMYFGRIGLVGYSEKEAFVLDLETGREKWFLYGGRKGPIEGVQVSPDETEVAVNFQQGCSLYAMNGRLKRDITPKDKAPFATWLPGEGRFVFRRYEKSAEDTAIEYWRVVEADSGNTVSEWKRELSRNTMSLLGSSKGELSEAVPKEDGSTSLRILDIRNGQVLREFDGFPGNPRLFFWMRDARRLCCLSEDRKRVFVADSETGAVLFSLAKENHCFHRRFLYEDVSGNAWTFSQDEEYGLYVWPVISDGSPRKVMNHVLSHFRLITSDRNYLTTRRWGSPDDDALGTCDVHSLDTLAKLASWKYIAPKAAWSDTLFSRDLASLFYIHPNDSTGNVARPGSIAFQVFLPVNTAPVYKGAGKPLAVSPNGRYAFVQTGPALSSLFDLESGKMVQSIEIPVPKGNPGYNATMEASFSVDGRRVAVNTTRSLEILEVTDGFPHWPMRINDEYWYSGDIPQLSPDGRRLLCGGGYRTAWLFDADTGELLHDFKETERFEDTDGQTYSSGFWGGLARNAKDWAGMLTDRFKMGCRIKAAFVEDGAKVITHAAGQIIRVWDAESGALLNTIHTKLPEKRDKTGQIKNKIALSSNGRFAFCYNEDNFGTASLWDLEDGTLARHYQFSEDKKIWPPAIPTDDGTAVYLEQNWNLYRWPGAEKPAH